MRKLQAARFLQTAPSRKVALVLMVVVVGMVAGFDRLPKGSHAAIAAPSTPTVAVCGVRKASDIEQYSGPTIPDSPISHAAISPSAGVEQFRFLPGSPDKWYFKTGHTITINNAATNAVISSFTIPGLPNITSDFAVDPDGSVYVVNSYYDIYKFSTSGTQLWTRHFNEISTGYIYGYGTGANFRVASSNRDGNSDVWSSDGTAQPKNIIPEGLAHYDYATGHIMWGNGREVAAYDATGQTRLFYMGVPDVAANDSGPMHLYIGGDIEELADGHYMVYDGTIGLKYFDANGAYLGNIKTDPLANTTGAINFMSRNVLELVHYNGNYYYMADDGSGHPQLSTLSDANASLMINSPQATPFGLGIGAGPYTSAPGNYFPSGTTPQVNLKFYPWWAKEASQFTGQYTIRSIQQVKANQAGTPVAFSIPSNMTTSPGSVAVTLPSQAPGYYEMDVRLTKDGATAGADCLRYSIGAPGQTLNYTTLPEGEANGVALAAQFGQKLYRGQYSMDQFLPASATDTTPMNLSSIDAEVKAAAAEAAKDGVVYEMQLATGSDKEKAIVAAGKWSARVSEWVNHFKADGVTTYEAWNEPNNTYGNATDFTNNVLKPFYTALKAADPTATAVGGGILGIDDNYFDTIGSLGGFNYMDAAGDHPYTGHNRSYEEQGSVVALQGLKAVFAKYGKPNMEIYNTESGFWNSAVNGYYAQDDKLIRKLVLQQSIGIEHYANFYNDGGYTVDGQFWALNGTYLNPAGLASVVYKQYIGQRQFLKWISTGIPHTYAAEYGGTGSDTSHMVVAWADDYSVDSKPSLSGGGTITASDEWGKTTTLASASTLTLTGSVAYLKVPAGQSLTLTPAESYSTNFARDNQGATATASSNAKNSDTGQYGLPAYAIDGIADTQNKGGNPEQISAWMQNATDSNPWLQVALAAPKTIDRVYVSSQGLGSVQTGLRSYDVQVDPGTGVFTTVAQVRDQYFARNKLVSFPAQTVSRIKLVNMSVNYSGYGDGLPPVSWPSDYKTAGDVWTGQTVVYELEAYAPGTGYVTPTPTPTPAPTATPTPTPAGGVRGDLNADSKVNVIDLSLLLGNWNKSGRGDINNDGTVNVIDLSILLSNWSGS